MDKENKLILYKDAEGKVSVNTRFAEEDVWLIGLIDMIIALGYRVQSPMMNRQIQKLIS